MMAMADSPWALWHFSGGTGWHWLDLLQALLALIAVAGVALVVAGRATQRRAARDRAGVGGDPGDQRGSTGI